MKQGNGMGSVYKLSGNRRKPYVAMVTVKTVYDEENDKYILKRKALGYFSNQNDARKCLAEYNDNPFSPELINITVDEIWKDILPKLETKISKSRYDCYTSAYKYLSPISNMRIKDVKTVHLQKIINDCEKKSSTKSNIKSVMNRIFEYALSNDLASKDYSKYIEFDIDDTEIERVLYTNEEINTLWNNQGLWYVDMVLILLYTGMRIREFLLTEVENVNLEEKYIFLPREIVKNKSSNRTVPIHEQIVPVIERFISYGKKDLAVKPNGTRIEYKNFMSRENKKDLPDMLGIRHTPHDTRHTFITHARECGCNNLVIQRIVGHTPDNITQERYTHLQMKELLEEINKIQYC